MKNTILLFCFILFFSACTNNFYDDGTNLTSTKQSKKTRDDGTNRVSQLNKNSSFDDGTNQYELSKKTSPKVSTKTKTKPVDKKIIPKKENKVKTDNKIAISKKIENPKEKLTTVNTTNKDFFYPVNQVNISKAYQESGSDKNSGLDFFLSSNTEIFSCSPGVVIFSGEKNGLGNTLFVYHNDGFISIYYNLSQLKVNKGDYIKNLDTIIAYADTSFHFELRQQTKTGIITLDPKIKLKKRRK